MASPAAAATDAATDASGAVGNPCRGGDAAMLTAGTACRVKSPTGPPTDGGNTPPTPAACALCTTPGSSLAIVREFTMIRMG